MLLIEYSLPYLLLSPSSLPALLSGDLGPPLLPLPGRIKLHHWRRESTLVYSERRRSSQPKDLLKGIQYTCLGLGDSNYTRFCAAPRAFASRFEALGAENFHPNKEVDEVDGLEEGVETWLESLRPALAAALKADKAGKAPEQPKKQAAPSPAADELVGVPALLACSTSLIWEEDENKVAAASTEASRPAAAELEYRDEHGLYGPEAPFWAPVTKCENLCAGWSDREVETPLIPFICVRVPFATCPSCLRYPPRPSFHPQQPPTACQVLHLEWDLSGSGMQCHPGDAMGVMPHNSEQLVEGIIGRLGADGSRVFSVAEADGSPARPGKLSHLRWPCTLRSALSTGCDLTGVPKKSLLRMLAEYCGDATEKHRLLFLCSRWVSSCLEAPGV